MEGLFKNKNENEKRKREEPILEKGMLEEGTLNFHEEREKEEKENLSSIWPLNGFGTIIVSNSTIRAFWKLYF